MLGKLIRYDLKSTTKFLVIIHIFLVAASVFGRIFLTGRLDFESDELNELLLTLAFVVYIIIFAGVSYGTYIVIAVRFYKNMFSDEGYLTNTLPVTKGMHLLSKTISGSIWCVIDMLLIYVCAYILLAIPIITDPLSAHWDEFIRLLGFQGQGDFNFFLFYMAVLTIVSAVGNVITIEASVVLGQLFNGHKVLGSVVSYFVITTVIAIASTVIMGAQGILSDSIAMNSSTTPESIDFAGYMMDILNISFGISVAIAVILSLLSYFIMKRKVNLS